MKLIITLIGVVLLFTGCGHKFMRGTVAMKISDNKAHACLGKKMVTVGDKVVFKKNQCTKIGSLKDGDFNCELVTLGNGTVSKVLNNHYSEITTDTKFSFEEGTIVEKVTN